MVEDRANGPAIISLLHSRLSGIVPVIPKDSKEARCVFVAPTIEAGDVHVPDPRFVSDSEWVEEFLLEFSRFPRGSHDDQVDAATQALQQLVQMTAAGPISIGIIGGPIGKGVFAGSNLPRPQITSAYGGSNLPDPYGRPSGGSNLPGGAPPGKPHHIF